MGSSMLCCACLLRFSCSCETLSIFLAEWNFRFCVTFSAILSSDQPGETAGGNRSTRRKPPPYPNSLATFTLGFELRHWWETASKQWQRLGPHSHQGRPLSGWVNEWGWSIWSCFQNKFTNTLITLYCMFIDCTKNSTISIGGMVFIHANVKQYQK